MNGVIADFGEAEDAFNLDDESRQFLGKLGVVSGSLNKVQQLFAHQIFQRFAKSETLLYALCGFALADEILFLTLLFVLSFETRAQAVPANIK